jgi:hypothetical protein
METSYWINPLDRLSRSRRSRESIEYDDMKEELLYDDCHG